MLKKILIFTAILIFNALPGFCNYENDISSLEMNRYGQIYSNESLAERLARLENDYFGMTQSSKIDERINMLNRMAKVTYNNPLKPNDNYYPGVKKSIIRDFWDKITDINGVLTGYTPPIYPEDEYIRSYSPEYYHYNNNYRQYTPVYQPGYDRHQTHNGLLQNNYAFNSFNPSVYTDRRINYNSYQPYIPQYTNRNYLTRSSVHILND